MARCPYLEHTSNGTFFSQGDYYCDLCKKIVPEIEVKNKCKTDDSESYKDCPVYRSR